MDRSDRFSFVASAVKILFYAMVKSYPFLDVFYYLYTVVKWWYITGGMRDNFLYLFFLLNHEPF